jgi:hypothetical protein
MTAVDIIYRDFCESEYGNDALDQAWFEYETTVGAIESNSPAEKLILAAMQYALDRVETN